MVPFRYLRAHSEEEVIRQLQEPGASVIAGGTGLVDLMKLNVEAPHHLVDLRSLGLDTIEVLPDGGIRIGAMVRNSALAHHPEIVRLYPVLSQAILSGASPQLRNMATTGGNLMQRTRCSYFRDPSYVACNKRDPGSGCVAMDGFNRGHAVLGGSTHCIATHPSDMAVALVALDAEVHIRGRQGQHVVPVAEFHLLPGETPAVETVLEPGEFITHVVLRNLPFAACSCYTKLRGRASYEFALASAAVALEFDGNIVRNARVVLGGVGTKPWRCPEAEQILLGSRADTGVFEEAARIALSGATASKYNDFKIDLARRAVVRSLVTLSGVGYSNFGMSRSEG